MRCQPLQPVRRECVRQCHRVCNTRHGVGGVPHRLRGCIRRGRKLRSRRLGPIEGIVDRSSLHRWLLLDLYRNRHDYWILRLQPAFCSCWKNSSPRRVRQGSDQTQELISSVGGYDQVDPAGKRRIVVCLDSDCLQEDLGRHFHLRPYHLHLVGLSLCPCR